MTATKDTITYRDALTNELVVRDQLDGLNILSWISLDADKDDTVGQWVDAFEDADVCHKLAVDLCYPDDSEEIEEAINQAYDILNQFPSDMNLFDAIQAYVKASLSN